MFADGKKVSKLLDGTSKFVSTYKDNDEDWMLVGDVPWRMFLDTVRRLRIVRTSDANGLDCGCFCFLHLPEMLVARPLRDKRPGSYQNDLLDNSSHRQRNVVQNHEITNSWCPCSLDQEKRPRNSITTITSFIIQVNCCNKCIY